MVPGFNLERTTVSFAGGMNANDRLGLNTSIQYITHEGQNRPAQGYDGNNPMSQLGVWWGRQVDMGLLKERYLQRFPEGHPAAGELQNWQRQYWNNPYYQALANDNFDSRDRLLGNVSANYQFTPWLTGLVRSSMDWYTDRRLRTWAEDNCCGTYTTNPLTASRDYVLASGSFGDWDLGFQELNHDFLLSATPELDLPISTSFTFGGNRRDWMRTHDYTWVSALATPGIFNVGNAATTPDRYVRRYEKRVNSLYGQTEFGYNNFAFLTLTGRNDWSSTLPEENNSYFYPSVSGSLVFSDAIPALQESSFLSYGKLRASWARVGNDTDPYQLRNTYLADEIFEGTPTFTVHRSERAPELGAAPGDDGVGRVRYRAGGAERPAGPRRHLVHRGDARPDLQRERVVDHRLYQPLAQRGRGGEQGLGSAAEHRAGRDGQLPLAELVHLVQEREHGHRAGRGHHRPRDQPRQLLGRERVRA
jgi:hypothetical protein